jgi:hypothetical protein
MKFFLRSYKLVNIYICIYFVLQYIYIYIYIFFFVLQYIYIYIYTYIYSENSTDEAVNLLKISELSLDKLKFGNKLYYII